MNIEKDNLLELFKEKVNDSLYPLKMGGRINENAFNELLLIAEEATRLLKDDDLVPKKLLLEIYLVSVGVDSENIRIKSEFLSLISSRLLDCFNFIIDGESIDNKKYNKPRII